MFTELPKSRDSCCFLVAGRSDATRGPSEEASRFSAFLAFYFLRVLLLKLVVLLCWRCCSRLSPTDPPPPPSPPERAYLKFHGTYACPLPFANRCLFLNELHDRLSSAAVVGPSVPLHQLTFCENLSFSVFDGSPSRPSLHSEASSGTLGSSPLSRYCWPTNHSQPAPTSLCPQLYAEIQKLSDTGSVHSGHRNPETRNPLLSYVNLQLVDRKRRDTEICTSGLSSLVFQTFKVDVPIPGGRSASPVIDMKLRH